MLGGIDLIDNGREHREYIGCNNRCLNERYVKL